MRPGSRIPFVPSAALLVRTDVALGPDLFDPALRGGEDVDLVWRLGEAGWDVRYVPASTVAHEGPATLEDFLARRAFYGTTAGAAEPTPRRGRWPRCTSPAGRWPCGPCCWPAGRCSR